MENIPLHIVMKDERMRKAINSMVEAIFDSISIVHGIDIKVSFDPEIENYWHIVTTATVSGTPEEILKEDRIYHKNLCSKIKDVELRSCFILSYRWFKNEA